MTFATLEDSQNDFISEAKSLAGEQFDCKTVGKFRRVPAHGGVGYLVIAVIQKGGGYIATICCQSPYTS